MWQIFRQIIQFKYLSLSLEKKSTNIEKKWMNFYMKYNVRYYWTTLESIQKCLLRIQLND